VLIKELMTMTKVRGSDKLPECRATPALQGKGAISDDCQSGAILLPCNFQPS